jgi:hypothetical protein
MPVSEGEIGVLTQVTKMQVRELIYVVAEWQVLQILRVFAIGEL